MIEDNCFGFNWFNITGPNNEGQNPDITATFKLLIRPPIHIHMEWYDSGLYLYGSKIKSTRNTHNNNVLVLKWLNTAFLDKTISGPARGYEILYCSYGHCTFIRFLRVWAMLGPCKAIETRGLISSRAPHDLNNSFRNLDVSLLNVKMIWAELTFCGNESHRLNADWPPGFISDSSCLMELRREFDRTFHYLIASMDKPE